MKLIECKGRISQDTENWQRFELMEEEFTVYEECLYVLHRFSGA